jgi:hypothetical protein
VQIAAVDDDPGLVDRAPGLHPAVELLEQDLAVVGEPVGDVGVQPAAAIVQRGGQVPVVEGAERLDALLQQAVDQTVVEVEAGLGLIRPRPSGITRLQETENR